MAVELKGKAEEKYRFKNTGYGNPEGGMIGASIST